MARIPVGKAYGSDAAEIAEDTRTLTEQIRQLAFHLFEARGGSDGHDLDDWLKAERELVVKTEPELFERDGRFEIRLSASGFEARDIHVTALPDSVVVKAESKNKPGENENKILLKWIDLPGTIDVDKTSARVENGMILVTVVRQPAHSQPAPA